MAQHQFGDYTLDDTLRQLYHQNEEVELPPLEMDALVLLVRAPGALVTYQELTGIERLNSAQRGAVQTRMSSLRRAIGDTGRRGLIRSEPLLGYRFRGRTEVHDLARSQSPRHGSSRPRSLHMDPAEMAEALDARADELSPYTPPRLRTGSIARLEARYASGPLADTIAALRGKMLQRWDGETPVTYPVVVFPAVPGQTLASVLPANNVDSHRQSAARAERLAIRDPFPRLRRWMAANPGKSYAEALKATTSGWNLCMTSLKRDGDGHLVIGARLAEYGLILDSCDALIDETFLGDTDAAWPLRDALEAHENPFDSGLHRAAGIGIAAVVTVVEREPNGSHVLSALVGRRSKEVGTYQDTWHVAPAGMFNYRFGSRRPHRDPLVRHGAYDSGDTLRSVLTEYAEETRNIAKLEDNTNREYLEGLEVVRDLVDVAQIEFTGIALDLANLRPEICVLIYVKDPAWHGKQEFALNYEYDFEPSPVGHAREPGEKRKLTAVPVARDGRPLDDALDILTPEQTVAAGAAAFWLGADRARQLFNDDLAKRGQV